MEVDKAESDSESSEEDESDSESSEEENNGWLCFDHRDQSQNIDTWLENNKPSQIEMESSGIDWISVSSPTRNKFWFRDVSGLVKSFDSFVASGKPINKQTIFQLAKQNSVGYGKWFFFTDSGAKVDYLFEKLAKGIMSGDLSPAISAKVSTYAEGVKHVICVHNFDFTNTHEVFMTEQAIRNIGIKTCLFYKPDAYTYLQVYKNNPWGLRSTLYRSTFDVQQSVSSIKEL